MDFQPTVDISTLSEYTHVNSPSSKSGLSDGAVVAIVVVVLVSVLVIVAVVAALIVYYRRKSYDRLPLMSQR